MYRHGDLIIRPIVMSPEYQGSQRKKLDHLILAKGEALGHKHEIVEGEAELFEENGTLYLKVNSEKAKVAHPEHKPISIPKGTYKIDHQREYVPEGSYTREKRVWD